MASVKKVTTAKGETRYRARYRDPAGKSKERWFDRKGDADKFLVSVQHRVLSGAYVDPTAGKVTFQTYAEQWRQVQVHHRTPTAEGYERSLRLHAYPVLGHRPIGAIQRSEIQAWVSSLTLAPSTVELVYRHVAAVFRAAVEDQVIPTTPCRRINLPEKQDGAEVVIPTCEQVAAVLDAVPARYRALVVLVVASGLRQGEALGLTVDRVDWLRRTLKVDRQLAWADRKPAFAPPKTRASHRTIPLPDEALTALTEHRRSFDRPGGTIEGLIFTNDHGEPIQRRQLSRILQPAWKAAGMPPGTGLHVLRHYYASALIHGNESVKVVQARLGHASAQETLDTYSHLWPDTEDRTRAAAAAGLVGLSWGWDAAVEG